MVMKMPERKEGNLRYICSFLPPKLSAPLLGMDSERKKKLCEIRIRATKPALLIFTDCRLFVSESGRLTSFPSSGLVEFSQKETESVFNSMCRYSVHSLTHDITEGFITLDGGCRVGVYGTAATDGERITSVRNIKGLNIRISGDFCGTASTVAERVYSSGRANVLICGPPSSGKTTMMKDLCRILSDEKGYKICIVDERAETGGSNTGVNTDVLTGYPKAKGIEIAVRTLSPEIIAFDEIGTCAEADAVCAGMNSGVNFIMTLHCADRKSLLSRPQYRKLAGQGAADFCVFLKGTGETGEIISAKELENENCRTDSTGTCLRTLGTVHSLRA